MEDSIRKSGGNKSTIDKANLDVREKIRRN